jgi:hypothetical protein
MGDQAIWNDYEALKVADPNDLLYFAASKNFTKKNLKKAIITD